MKRSEKNNKHLWEQRKEVWEQERLRVETEMRVDSYGEDPKLILGKDQIVKSLVHKRSQFISQNKMQ